MQLSIKSLLSWLERLLRLDFQAILLVFLLIWTPLLANTTLQVQHSCDPMIHWSGEFPAECKQIATESKSSINQQNKTTKIKPDSKPKSEVYKPLNIITEHRNNPKLEEERAILEAIKEQPDLTAGAIGIAVATGVALIGAAPAFIVVGSGFLTWLAIRIALSI
ncbi:hypothetical protein CDG77_03995 [Nostoc sp. 'Peltigera membranacea cyanobiont' 213]|uniref:hypothetical protein n=1 Tax=Nostoc cyanobionts TaxID=3123326 RepID=UPI000B9555EB|nr:MULTISPECIES: hypothetical protein [unclassified Nostoc]AVH66751.1 hypothetical protein NPM_5302 [Nostoc sp. 'Peltigera membranacea cyanobiont' N6]OYD98821.1 hypothetical protein CDG77_03995 [Nostoc sp. 'Peltigera membranacea cyanobiont' 213]